MEVEERAEGGFIDERGKTYLSTTATLQNMYTTTPWPLAPPAHQKVLSLVYKGGRPKERRTWSTRHQLEYFPRAGLKDEPFDAS